MPVSRPRFAGPHSPGDDAGYRGLFARQASVDQGAGGLGLRGQGLGLGDQGLDAPAWPRRRTRSSDELDTAKQARPYPLEQALANIVAI